jgi:hypothetical protein
MLKGVVVWCDSSLLLGNFLPYFGTVSSVDRYLAGGSEREAVMAKSTTSRGKSGGGSKATFDKIAKAAMSREMLAAGLTAAAAAIAASPKARKAIRDAGLDAADTASQAATQMMTNASKLGSLIAEAVADAAQRVLSGKWADEGTGLTATSKPVAKKSAPRKAGATRKAPAAKAAATRKPAAKKSAAKKPAARKSSSPAKRRSSSGARKRAAAKPKAPPQS